jgi:hypothetical protein
MILKGVIVPKYSIELLFSQQILDSESLELLVAHGFKLYGDALHLTVSTMEKGDEVEEESGKLFTLSEKINV